MDPIRKIPKKFTKKSGDKVINRPYFCRKTGLQPLTNEGKTGSKGNEMSQGWKNNDKLKMNTLMPVSFPDLLH